MAKLKYSKEETSFIYDNYTQCETQDDREKFIEKYLADNPHRSKRSLISLLSILKIYKTRQRVSKLTGTAPETKSSLVKRIEKMLGVQDLVGLDKAPKITLLRILKEKP